MTSLDLFDSLSWFHSGWPYSVPPERLKELRDAIAKSGMEAIEVDLNSPTAFLSQLSSRHQEWLGNHKAVTVLLHNADGFAKANPMGFSQMVHLLSVIGDGFRQQLDGNRFCFFLIGEELAAEAERWARDPERTS